MQICRITGNVVATIKNSHLKGKKIMIVQPLDLDGNPEGDDYLAIDTVSAGPDDKVLVIKEGGSAAVVGNDKKIPVQAIIVGVVDEVDIPKS